MNPWLFGAVIGILTGAVISWLTLRSARHLPREKAGQGEWVTVSRPRVWTVLASAMTASPLLILVRVVSAKNPKEMLEGVTLMLICFAVGASAFIPAVEGSSFSTEGVEVIESFARPDAFGRFEAILAPEGAMLGSLQFRTTTVVGSSWTLRWSVAGAPEASARPLPREAANQADECIEQDLTIDENMKPVSDSVRA